MKNIFLALLILISAQAIGQRMYGPVFSTGVLTARTEVSFVGRNDEVATHKVTYLDATQVYSAGFFFQETFGWLYFQPELRYAAYDVNFEVEDFTQLDRVTTQASESFQYIDLQVTAGLTANNYRFGVGPVFHYLAGYDNALDFIGGYNEKIKNITYGFTGSFGYNFGKVIVDLRYENALKTFGDHIYFENSRSKLKGGPDQISISIGYGF